MEFIGASPVLAFHAPFDQRMLSRALHDSLGYKLQHLFIDLADVAPLLYPDAGIRKGGLDDWVRYCGLQVQDCATVRRDPAQHLQLTSVIYLMTAQLDGVVERCNQQWLTGEGNV